MLKITQSTGIIQLDSRVITGQITANTHYLIDNIEIKNHVITSKLTILNVTEDDLGEY